VLYVHLTQCGGQTPRRKRVHHEVRVDEAEDEAEEKEKEAVMQKCHDCGVAPGELHQLGCDVERCLLCGGQAISCSCIYRINDADQEAGEATDKMWEKFDAVVKEKGGRLPWTGEWPGAAECIEFGWYSRVRTPADGPGDYWMVCKADDPGAGPNLNRLHEGAVTWSVEKRRWVLLS
jgi:hypothetical protein